MMEMEDWVEVYCKIYEVIYQRISKLNPEKATDVSLEIFKEIIRDLTREEAKVEKKESENLATKKQREALHKFGIKHIPEGLSLKEASEILDKLIGFSKEGDSASIAKTVEELNKKWSQQQ